MQESAVIFRLIAVETTVYEQLCVLCGDLDVILAKSGDGHRDPVVVLVGRFDVVGRETIRGLIRE